MKTQTAFLRHPLAIVLLLVSLTVIAVSGWWYLQSLPAPPKIEATPEVRVNPKEPAAVEPSTAIKPVAMDETATPTTTAIPTEFRWSIGARQTYRYQSQVNLKIDMGMTLQANSAWQTINSELSGILNMRLFDHKHDRIRLGFQLSSVNLTMNGQTFPRFTALFGTFFLVEMSKQGKPLYFHFPRYINVANQKFIQEIINSIQVVLPVTPTQAWQAHEMHNTGYYQAHYQRQSNHEIHKYKTNYLNITLQNVGHNSDDNLMFSLTDKIHQSNFTARLASQQAWLNKLTGQEKIDIHTPQGKLASLESQLQLTLSDDRKDPGLAIWQAPNDYERVLKQFATATGDPTLSQDVVAQTKLDALREHYANTDLTTLVNSISSLFPEPDLIKAADIIPHIQKLEELLTAYPDQALEMPALLETLNPSQKLSAYLIGVLETVGTPQAQQALSTIAINPEPQAAVQNRAVQAIMSFNFIQKPEPQVAETLWQLADSDNAERADTALLAIGSVMSNVDSEQYSQVRETLSERLQQSTPAEQPILLKAIGNSGDTSFLPEIEPYLTADKSRVRAAAVQAMRGFDDPLVVDHLVNAITTDSHRDVRQAALKALQEREDQLQAVSTLKDYLPQETEYKLQKKLIQFLGKHKQEAPEVMEVLQQQLAQESDREMKKLLYTEIYR